MLRSQTRPNRTVTALAGVLAALLLHTGARPSAATTCANVRLCIAIDGSGSINSSEFNLMKTGLADAVGDPTVVPQNGTVELTFVQFGSSVSTHVAPIVIDSQSAANGVVAVLQNMPKAGGGTNMSGAIDLCRSWIAGSCGSSRQVINVVTDGSPDSQSATLTARNNAIAAGIGEINAEAVDAPSFAFTFLRDQLVHPQPGVEAPPFTSPGFVIRTDRFEDFATAVRGKIGQIVGPQGCTIEPAEATNPVGTEHTFTVTVHNTDGTPAVGVTVNVTLPSGPNAGIGGAASTDSNGEVGFRYTDQHGPGTDTIEASG